MLYLILTITWYFDTPSKGALGPAKPYPLIPFGNLPDLTGNLELRRKLNVAFCYFRQDNCKIGIFLGGRGYGVLAYSLSISFPFT